MVFALIGTNQVSAHFFKATSIALKNNVADYELLDQLTKLNVVYYSKSKNNTRSSNDIIESLGEEIVEEKLLPPKKQLILKGFFTLLFHHQAFQFLLGTNNNTSYIHKHNFDCSVNSLLFKVYSVFRL